MEKFVEINSSGEVVLDKEIILTLKPKGTRLKCLFDGSKILLIPEESQDDILPEIVRSKDATVATVDKISLEDTLRKLELEHKERVSQRNLREEFEQLVQEVNNFVEQNNVRWQGPEEVIYEMRKKREMNIMESLESEK